MQTGPRMDAEAIAGTAQIHCGRGLTPARRWGPALSSHVLEVAARVCLSVQERRVQPRLDIDKNQEKIGQSVQQAWASPHSSHGDMHNIRITIGVETHYSSVWLASSRKATARISDVTAFTGKSCWYPTFQRVLVDVVHASTLSRNMAVRVDACLLHQKVQSVPKKYSLFPTLSKSTVCSQLSSCWYLLQKQCQRERLCCLFVTVDLHCHYATHCYATHAQNVCLFVKYHHHLKWCAMQISCKGPLIVGALVTWAIYTQGHLLLWSSLIITGDVPGYK